MNFLNKAAYRVLLLLFSLAFLVMLIEPYSNIGFVEPLSVVILSIGLFFILRWIYQHLNNFSRKKLKILILSVFVLFVILQIFWINLAHVQLFGDPWHIQTQAIRLSQGSKVWDVWILRYPNLLPMVSLYLGFIKLSQFLHLGYYVIFYTYNVLVNMAIWALILRFIWRKNVRTAAFIAILLLFLPPAYAFLPQVGYSDGIAILALVLLLTIFDKAQERKKFTMASFIGTAVIFTLAYLARPNIIVLIVALMIIAIYAYLWRTKLGRLWKLACQMMAACLVGILLATGASYGLAKATNFDTKSASALPTLHWVYMGLNNSNFGEYNPTDVNYSENHIGYETASQADMAGIIHRLKSENILIPGVWLVKFATLWCEGTFQTLTDYQAFDYSFNWSQGPGWLIQNIGALDILLETYAKALIAVFLAAILLRLRQTKRVEINSFGLMLLTIMGISLFHTLIWEVKPRYQFMTFGLIVLAAALSFDSFFNEKNPLLALNKSDGFRKFLKIFTPVASLASILLMATVMQLQEGQKIVVNAQQHPIDNYGYSNDDYTLQPGETIYQDFSLPIAADQINWQTGTSAPLTMTIQKNLSNNWSDFDAHTIATDNVPAQEVSQKFTSKMSAGDYRFAISNPNPFPTTLKMDKDTAYLDYPHLIRLPNGQTASLGFIISQSARQSKYPPALIAFYALLFVLVNLLVFLL